MYLVPFLPSHLDSMILQDSQKYADGAKHIMSNLASSGISYTAMVDGEPVCCGGFLNINGVIAVWALIADGAGRHMVALTRAVLGQLTQFGHEVITAISWGHMQGYRWAKMLGFRRTGIIALDAWGNDCEIVVRG